jgi:hypothetical protein
MRVAGVLFDVVDVVGDAVVLLDMADAVKMHLLAARTAGHPVAVDDPVQPFVKGRAAFRAADSDVGIFEFFLVGIEHGNDLRKERIARNY